MELSRRHLLAMGALGATGAAALAGCRRGGGGGGTSGESGGTGTLQFTWWGNEVRNANTADALDAYMEENPDITIEPQPGEWASYWDRLATQTAGNNAPDIIQMDMRYISEYGQRGALLDLAEHGVDTSNFIEGTADSGMIEGALYGMNAGINTPMVFANPEVFEAAGVDLPDDMTWTWEDWLEIATAISDSGAATGTQAIIASDALFEAWLRQQGKSLFAEGGEIGFEVDDLRGWFDLGMRFADAGATPSPSAINEDFTKPLDQADFVVGNTAIAQYWSNQLQALETSAGTEFRLLRFPSIEGDALQRAAWYKASMLWSISAETEDPEAAVAVINWWMNSTTAAEIELAERGIPPNGEISAAIREQLSEPQQRVSQFIEDIEPELAQTPVAPAPGGQTDVFLQRHATQLLFGDATVDEAAQGFYDELSAAIS
ncbi:ABC transporter substrate-binding protein [Ruania alba]|uniref:Carbohydrate ABC transporter substrate-binding protein, CUT1 family n=1 Tax=Ruania alba TaxID=648782 RepID=A0A1H5LW83_9MICO|nr:extracellular solute-binding protein [Ruania alba]SEE81279.1 carbohydrate ABC transporter substrate-binding protein, CUT1 family [Ruania alba]